MSKIGMLLVVVVAGVALPQCAYAQYSQAVGSQFAYYAGAAYCTQSKISSWACNKCERGFRVGQVIFNSASNIQAFVGYRQTSNEIIVSFRGTVQSSIKNWATNLNADTSQVWSPACSGCAVHTGFLNAYRSVSTQVLSAVRSLRSQFGSASVAYTGHSLGGAMAVLAAVEFSVLYSIPAGRVVTFGEPRVGNSAFASFAPSRLPQLWRVTNNKDIVVHVPFKWMGFNHHPNEAFYSSATAYSIYYTGESDNGANRYAYAWQWSADDHLSYLGMAIGTSACT